MESRWPSCLTRIMTAFSQEKIFIPSLHHYLTRSHCGSLVLLSCLHLIFLPYSLSPLFPENVETTETGGISYSTFIGLWSLLLRYEATLTLYTLLQMGYWRDYHSLIRWVRYLFVLRFSLVKNSTIVSLFIVA